MIHRLAGSAISSLNGSSLRVSACHSVNFATTSPAPLPKRVSSDTVTRRTVNKTTKNRSDLPTVLIKDGCAAEPLPDFIGGLEASSVRRPKRRKKGDQQTVEMSPSRESIDTPCLSGDAQTKSRSGTDDGREDLAASNPDEPGRQPLSLPATDLAKEILANLQRFPQCILLTKVGQFYESYFSQAKEVAALLSIKLTSRRWGGQNVPMSGFPVIQIDRHLRTLIHTHKRPVALCDEFPSEDGSNRFSRRVTRVLTPGTVTDDALLNPFENNFLLSISSEDKEDKVGIAWIDISTGEFFSELTNLGELAAQIARIRPREIVMRPPSADNEVAARLLAQSTGCYTTWFDPGDQVLTHRDLAPSDLDTQGAQQLELSTNELYSGDESCAIFLLIRFLKAHLLDYMPTMTPPTREKSNNRMQIDACTLQALEITERMRDGSNSGSLLSVVRRTVSGGGTRLLSRYLCSPSTSLQEIKMRQNLIKIFCSKVNLRHDTTALLKRLEDASRIVQRFLLGRADVSDLMGIRNTIQIWDSILKRVRLERDLESSGKQHRHWSSVDALLARLNNLNWLATRIDAAIGKNGPDIGDSIPNEALLPPERSTDRSDAMEMTSRPPYGARWKLQASLSPRLEDLHDQLSHLFAEKYQLEEELRAEYGVNSLSLRNSPSLGPHVHLAKAKRDGFRIDQAQQFVIIHQSTSTKSYFHDVWSKLHGRIIDTIDQLVVTEKEEFEALRIDVNAHIQPLRENARVMDELDVACGFAQLADEMKFVCPSVNEGDSLLIKSGRHPTVEWGLLGSGRNFTANDLDLNPRSHVHIITGPNMAGKSTFLRQTALLAILAQTGSFIPAEHAEMGIVDKIFTRIGAADDLYRDRSTFMVEMEETANILRKATKKSLVIMDEIGRGTTTKEGLAVAFAVVNHLYGVNKCRALFATHFHEIVDLLGYDATASEERSAYPNIEFYYNDVNEIDSQHFAYAYKLRKGVNRESHALKVAQLSGVPTSAIDVARRLLTVMGDYSATKHGDQKSLRLIGKSISQFANVLK